MTKILTALVVLETADLDQEITVTEDADDTGVNIDLKEGEVLTVEQLLYAMMLYSANDAADALAIGVGGSVEGFCKMMNERAARCGATDTEFANASGLNTYGDAAHLTTAYDIAVITREAMKNETFRKIVATEKYEIPATNMSKARKIKSINYCLVEDEKTVTVNGMERPYKYEGTTGVKTGYTEIAGQCFCGTAKRGDTGADRSDHELDFKGDAVCGCNDAVGLRIFQILYIHCNGRQTYAGGIQGMAG